MHAILSDGFPHAFTPQPGQVNFVFEGSLLSFDFGRHSDCNRIRQPLAARAV